MTRMWPKADALVITRLNATTGSPAASKIPNPRPAKYFQVEVTGSTVRSPTVRDVQVTIGATAATESDASDLADEAVAALTDWETDVAWVPEADEGWAGGPYSFPDPIADLPRYQMTVIVRTTLQGDA
jgi:hypothetical protein